MFSSWMIIVLCVVIVGTCAALMVSADAPYSKLRDARAHQVDLDGKNKRQLFNPFQALINKRFSPVDRVSYSECQLNDTDKLDCGYIGIDNEECRSRGCCWKESNTPGAPWCYHSNAQATPQCTILEQHERLDCGYYGIKEHECTEVNGCCWMPANDPAVPWCFSPGEGGPAGDCGVPAIAPRRIAARIVGGMDTIPHSWPWQVSIRHTDGTHWCGGSLISPKWVVTAAHCEPVTNTVVVGMHSLKEESPFQKEIQIEHLIPHENYVEDEIKVRLLNDIMLLKLSEPVHFGEHISPVCLPRAGFEVPDGTACFTTGWGRLNANDADVSDILQQVMVPTLGISTCAQPKWYGDRLNGMGIPKMMVCAGYAGGGKDSCQGDSGGPFVCFLEGKWELIGVVSWGDGCAGEKKPGLYAKTSTYIDWIEEKIAKFGID